MSIKKKRIIFCSFIVLLLLIFGYKWFFGFNFQYNSNKTYNSQYDFEKKILLNDNYVFLKNDTTDKYISDIYISIIDNKVSTLSETFYKIIAPPIYISEQTKNKMEKQQCNNIVLFSDDEIDPLGSPGNTLCGICSHDIYCERNINDQNMNVNSLQISIPTKEYDKKNINKKIIDVRKFLETVYPKKDLPTMVYKANRELYEKLNNKEPQINNDTSKYVNKLSKFSGVFENEKMPFKNFILQKFGSDKNTFIYKMKDNIPCEYISVEKIINKKIGYDILEEIKDTYKNNCVGNGFFESWIDDDDNKDTNYLIYKGWCENKYTKNRDDEISMIIMNNQYIQYKISWILSGSCLINENRDLYVEQKFTLFKEGFFLKKPNKKIDNSIIMN